MLDTILNWVQQHPVLYGGAAIGITVEILRRNGLWFRIESSDEAHAQDFATFLIQFTVVREAVNRKDSEALMSFIEDILPKVVRTKNEHYFLTYCNYIKHSQPFARCLKETLWFWSDDGLLDW